MTGRHQALIVEDDAEIAEELKAILLSLECDSVVVSNKQDASAALKTSQFCFVLLDLEIKLEPASIKGHVEYGNSLLREFRQMHSEHTGHCYWTPVLIVSGFSREVDTAVEVMKDGANDVIHKPFSSKDISKRIRDALERADRKSHGSCGKKPSVRVADPSDGMVLSISGDRVGRRTVVRVGSKACNLTDGSLTVLLHLVVGLMEGKLVHKRDLGAADDKGFKGISRLREELKGALPDGIDIIGNDHHGSYWLTEWVTIGNCDTDKLAEIGGKIAELSQQLASTSSETTTTAAIG